MQPEAYEAWYHTPRGQWIAQNELSLLLKLMQPDSGSSLLDVGCGTGYFSRQFQAQGLTVTGIDPDSAALSYASAQDDAIEYLQGSATALAFADDSYDYVTAITSLCFIEDYQQALVQMWRVARKGVLLGLLNRNSVLYRQKADKGAYQGARWDSWREMQPVIAALQPVPKQQKHGTAIVLPGGGRLARTIEQIVPTASPFGGFLAIYLQK